MREGADGELAGLLPVRERFVIALACTVLLSACFLAPHAFYHPPVFCTSRCGLTIVESAPPANWCDDLQLTEDAALRAYMSPAVVAYDPRFAISCALLKGWLVQVVPSATFTGSRGNQVAGETNCVFGRILVGNALPGHGALGHELGHAIQRCHPNAYSQVDPDHAGWAPIFTALKAEGLVE